MKIDDIRSKYDSIVLVPDAEDILSEMDDKVDDANLFSVLLMERIEEFSTSKNSPSLSPPTTSSQRTDSSNYRLLKLELPKFDGNRRSYHEFIDLFDRSIGNNTQLSDTERLVYLKSYLIGDAKALLSGIEIFVIEITTPLRKCWRKSMVPSSH